MGSAAFLLQKPQAFGTHRGSATSLFTMSDDAAATAPAAAVPAGAAPLTRGQDQLPALRAARAVLKQQLKESTKEIRKEPNVPPLPFYPWCGEQILEPNPIDTEQNKVKTFQKTVRSLLSKSHRHGAK